MNILICEREYLIRISKQDGALKQYIVMLDAFFWQKPWIKNTIS